MKKSICFSALCLLFTVQLLAYDTESNGLYFNKITTVSPNEMEVTYKSMTIQSGHGSVTGGTTLLYNLGWDITTADIPRIVTSCKVTTIGSCAFRSCSSLTKVVMPYYLKKVKSDAFYGCSKLQQVHVTSIEKWCEIEFSNTSVYGLTSLYYPYSSNPLRSAHHLYVNNVEVKDLVIPSTVTSLNNYAFMGCQGLTSVTLPNTVTTVGDAVFSGCTGLSSPVYNEHVFAYMPVSYSGDYAIPDGISSIAGYACTGCSTLVSVTIPQSVTEIGKNAFYYCIGLTSVTIPNNVTSLGDYAFSGCASLTSLTCEATTPPTLGSSVFYNVDKSIPLYVPAESIDAYKVADQWKDFTNIQAIPCILASGTCGKNGDNLTWELSCDSVLTISGTGNMADYQPWSSTKDAIKSVIIEDGVTSIGRSAFINCRSLTSIDIPNSITSIENYAFSYCRNLTSVTIPNSVQTLGDYAFYYCTGLTSATIGTDLVSMGCGVFSECYNLLSINVTVDNPNFCSEEGVMFYKSKTKLVECPGGKKGDYTIPNTVVEIGREAFYHCDSLTSVTIPEGVETICARAFSNCANIMSITIPNSVTTIGEDAFASDEGSSIVSVVIGSGVTSIANYAFLDMSQLRSLICYAVVPPSLGDGVFGGYVLPLSEIPLYVPSESIDAYKAADQWKDFTNIQAIPCILASGTCGAQGDNLTWELSCDSVLTISGTGAMASLANMDQPWRNYMKRFKSVVIGDGVTSIGDSAFYKCSSLTAVTIPSSVTSIGRLALSDCSSLTSVTIPNSVTSIGYGTFVGCIGLTAMTVDAGNTVYDSRNNCNAIIETATNTLVVGCQNTVIPSSVTSIGDGAFRGCTGLTSVTIPSSVTSIEGCAFWYSGLTSIDIPSSVTSIGRQAFVNCYELASVDIPNSVTSIGNGAFINCRSLTSIDIPNSITSIGDSTFYHCTGLTAVTIPSGVTSIGLRAFYQCSGMTSLTLSNSVTSMGVGVFCGCYSLTSMTVDAGNTVFDSRNNCNAIIETTTNTLIAGCQNTVIPSGVTSIGNFAFRECSTLTSINIPNSVTSIGNGAFYNCSDLTSVTIPGGVINIGQSAFSGCSGLTSISCRATNAPELGSNMFKNVSKSIPLLVPAESIELYRAADQWKDFTRILPICPNSGTCGAQGDNLTWELSCDSVLTISGTGAMASLANTDPLWRAYMGNFKSVVIGNGVTSIGDSAFYNCSNLTSVTIPSGVTSIGARAFYKCHNLTSVTIPSSVTSIGIGAFCDGSGLTSMSVEAGNTVYDSRDNCNAIIETATNRLIVGCQNTVIPSSVTGIGDNAFRECSSLGSIDIPNSVTSIGHYAFRACTGLTSVTIGNSVISIGRGAFYKCNSLTSLIIPYGVTDIGEGAFSYGSGLTSVIIPNSVTSIGDGAFYYCSGLTSVTIPSSVTGIGEYALGGCVGLTSITCKATNVPELGGNVFYLVDKSIPLNVPAESVDAYKAADQWKDFNVQAICLLASGTCGAQGDNLTWELTCDSVLTISGTGAMADYSYDSQLPWCSSRNSITSVVINDGVTSIETSAFNNCTSLTSVTIPGSVTSIGAGAFKNCSSLTSMSVTAGNTIYDSRENCNAIIETATNTLVAGCQNTLIPSSVTSIDTYAFYQCSGLTSVTIPNIVKSIGSYAFYGCSGLTSVTIPNSVASIGKDAFRNCSGLTAITVEAGNTNYDSRDNCNAIIRTATNTLISGCQNTFIPSGVTSIGEWAFSDCRNLTSLTIPNSVTSIGNSAFVDCSSLTSITIPNSVTSIGNDAFTNCSNLTSVTIGNSVASIGNFAFISCSNLTSITIPNSVTSIGGCAFYFCSGLTALTCEATTPPTIGNTVFYGVDKSIPLYVPAESIDAYKAADQWKEFTNIRPIIRSYSVSSSDEDQGSVVITHEPDYSDLTLSFTATPAQGYEFLQWNDGNTDNPRSLTLVQDTVITAEWVKLYAITWKNADGTVLATDTVREGVTPTYTGATPIKAADAQYTYTFNGWTPNVVAAAANAIYTATYSQTVNTYTVTFLDEDGTQLGQQTVAYGSAAIAPEVVVPDCHHLTWDVDFSNITGDLTVNAVRSLDIIASGTCGAQGDNLAWELTCDSILSIRGTGVMMDLAYGDNTSEWKTYSDKIKHVVFSEGVTKIGDHAFMNCYNLASVRFPNTMTNIGWSSFNGCSSLISVIVPEGVTYISYATFSNCSSLTSITLPSSLTSIADFAFSGCTALATITIPRNVTDLYHSVFSSCTGLTSITCEAVIPPTMVNDAFYNVDRTIPLYVPALSMPVYKVTERWKEFLNIQTLETAPTYTHVKIGALYYNLYANSLTAEVTYDQHWYNSNYSGLQNISIPNAVVYSGKTYNVVRIGVEAFGPCTSLSTVTIPSSIKTIGKNAFYNCVALTNVNMSEELVYMDDGVFSGCSQLTSVTIPQSVAYMGTTMFHSCTKLRNVTLPDGLDSVGYQMFYRCSGLSNMVLPDSVRQIGNYAFSGCSSMTAIYIPEHVRSIGMGAFSNCSGLRAIELPKEIESIDYVAFEGCTGLTSFTCNAITPPSLTCPVFEDVNTSIPLNVPCAGIPQYRATFCWNNFTNIQAIDTIVITPYLSSVNPNNGSVNIVERSRIACDTLLLTIKADPSDGYDFLQWSDGNTDNPRSLILIHDTVITAEWVKTYIITWQNADSTVLATDTVREGVTPAYTGATPTKAATAQYTYTFNGWSPNVVAAAADAIYTATYSQTVNTYTVTFLDEDGTQLESKSVAYGETPVYTGETPTKDEDAQYTYTFEGWTPAIAAVTADATYTAVYSAEAKAPTAADYVPSTGRDFWLTYMYNFGRNDDNIHLMVYAIPNETAIICVYDADGVLLTSSPVAAGAAFTYEIPRDKAYMTTSGVKAHLGVHVTSTAETTVYLSNRYDSGFDYSYDQTPVIATSSLGKEYVIQTYYRDLTNTEFAFVATEDGTTVHVNFNHEAVNDAGTNFQQGSGYDFTMNRGDVYQFKGVNKSRSGGFHNLSGTSLYSNKPIAVFNGGIKGAVPYMGGVNGDHIVEQAIPVQSWGKRFIAMEMSAFPIKEEGEEYVETSSPTFYYITALYDNTEIKVNGTTWKTLNAYESSDYSGSNQITVGYNEAPKLIETSHPVIMYAYMTNGAMNSYDYDVFSEPSSSLIPDVNMGVKRAVVYCDNSIMTLHYANIVVDAAHVSTMRLNGSDISSQFQTLSQTFLGYPTQYAYARVQLAAGVNVIENADAPFVAVQYHAEVSVAISEAGATAFSLTPTAPVMFIDDNEVVHGDTLDYCNRHSGVHFTAVVDYPHTGVKWVLGEGAESTDYETTHMYGKTISQGDTTHNVRLYVFRESPLTHIKDTDSVCVSLVVHPVYYDTLRTKVAAKKPEYIWNKSSNPAFGIAGKGELNVGPVVMGKNATNPNNRWTSAHDRKVIIDSLVYTTQAYGCDSIFYLQLEVVPDIIMDTLFDTICHSSASGVQYEWYGHPTGDPNHKLSRENSAHVKTYDVDEIYKLDEAGDFIIRDTIESKMFPYPDSICVLKLHISLSPMVEISNRKDSLCEAIPGSTLSWTVEGIAEYADSLHYSLKNSSSVEVRQGGIRRANPSVTTYSIDIDGLESLADGEYNLSIQAFNGAVAECEGNVDVVPLVIMSRPSLKIAEISTQCYPADEFIVHYTQTGATKIMWTVDDKITAEKTHIVNAQNTLRINAIGWAAGTYTLRARPVSALGCDSMAVVKTFVINNKPTITITSIESPCDMETTTSLSFSTADAITYKYYIAGVTSLSAEEVVTNGNQTIRLDISALSAGEYTLKMVANSATCASDTASARFTIYPTPTATITSTAADLSTCAPSTSDMQVSYIATNASQIKWQLTTPRGVKNYDYAAAGTTLTIPRDSLVCPGNYKVKITGVKSTHGCETLNPVGGEVAFNIYTPATVVLGHIDNVCAGEQILAPYSMEYADTYRYKVMQGSTEKFNLAVDSVARATGTIIVPLLEAGDYKLVVKATNEYGCAAGATDEKTFTIYPLPTITVNTSSVTVCEGADDAVFKFTMTNANTYSYNLLGTSITASNQPVPAGGVVTITLPNASLTPGDFTLQVTATSVYGCNVATPVTAALIVNNQPSVNMTAPAAQCYPASSIEVAYAPVDVKTFTYTVKQGSTVTDSGEIAVPTSAPYKFNIITSGWAAGAYTIEAKALSAEYCDGKTETVNFIINSKPTVSITNVESNCYGEASSAVVYNQTNATKYEYRVVKSGVAAPVIEVTNQDVSGATFFINTSTLVAGNYQLHLVTKSATCESDTAKAYFEIYPMPTVTALSDVTICETDAGASFSYTMTNAKTYTYDLKNSSHVTVLSATAQSVPASSSGTITINTAGLPDGTYTLHVTATSENGCVSAEKISTLKINNQPLITLSDIAAQCYPASSIEVAYASVDAKTITYTVKQGSTTKKSAETITPTGALDMFSFSTAGWEAGTYTIEAYATSAYGCDSEIEKQTFSIIPAVNVVLDTVVCESYEWGTLSITESGTYSQRFEAANGCDSVVTINVTVKNPKYTATTVETCDSYTWNGVTYTESGTYVHEYSDDVCDNADTLHLTITTPVENEDAATICAGEPFVWRGQRLSEAGTYSDTVRSVGGCDSVIYRMNLTVAESYYDSITATACDEYVWNVNGNTYMKSGIYREELLSANGCDSILVLNLTIYNSYEFNETYTIEDTELPFTVHDSTYTKAGKYDIAYTTVNGCDSIYHITVIVKTIGAETLSVDGVISAADMDLGANSTVTITPNGHLVVPYPVYIDKLLLDYSDGHHAQVTGIGNIHAEVVEVLLNFPTPKGQLSKHWFAFAVPFEVSVATGIRLSGSDTPARCGYDFVIDEFDGVLRATKQKGWKRLSADAILYPGRMYMFATPKGTSWVLTAADPSELIEQTGTNISANTSSIGANHAGWNGIANTMFANATAEMSGVTWITTYNNVLGVYETQEISDFVFIPSVPFFVQVTENAVFEFNDIPLFAPRRAQAENETSSITKLMLTDAEATHSDKVYVNFVTEKEEETYLIGHDLLKVAATSQSVHQLWWDAYDMQLSAYEAQLGDEPRALPIGLYAPEDGDYTLSIMGVPADISVYLTKDGQPVWDIVKSGYTLPLNAGNNDGYALYVRRAKDVTTDCRTTETETKVQKVVMDDKIFILRDGKTYSIIGAVVR